MQDFNQAYAYCSALSHGEDVFDFRAIHDKDKSEKAHPIRGRLIDVWQQLVEFNNKGFGIFCTVNQLDGVGREMENVQAVRAHFIDLDNASAMINLQNAAMWHPAPSFMVQSSTSKAHVYWPVQPYLDDAYFQTVQKKLIQLFDGDDKIFDLPRVMRVPGFYHLKGEPILVTCSALSGYGMRYNPVELATALQHVVVTETFSERHELGDPELAAPSLHWVKYAMDSVDPNDLDRGEWIGFSAAIKQAAWTLTDEQTLFQMWSDWCARYTGNDVGENRKQWNSIRNTQLGWKSIVSRVPNIKAHLTLGQKTVTAATAPAGQPEAHENVSPMPEPPQGDCSGELLTSQEQKTWFDGCAFVVGMGKIYGPPGRFMNVTTFNATFGGKKFIIDQFAKTTDEPWKAATRSTLGTIPKVDHVRFLPHRPQFEISEDELGRKGVNTYKPAKIKTLVGDATPFLTHMQTIIPDQTDLGYLLSYMAHNVKYPGAKIPWSPLVQSAEGIGKQTIKKIMEHAVGRSYTYFPSARQMVESGAKFNEWMRSKLLIVVDEIRTDERRDMIEVLKPFITETEIEIEGKGVDQQKEDNYANWIFFSNWKDAIPIHKNGRRFSIFYSPLQTEAMIFQAGLTEEFFNNYFYWLEHQQGYEIVANYLMNYPIERGRLPMRSPKTTSYNEALEQSQGPLERLVTEAILDELPGFKGGYVSTIAIFNRLASTGNRKVAYKTVQITLEQMGMAHIGRAPRAFFAESPDEKTHLFHYDTNATVEAFGRMQGYE